MGNLRQKNPLRWRCIGIDLELETVGSKCFDILDEDVLVCGRQLEALFYHQSSKRILGSDSYASINVTLFNVVQIA